MDNVKTGLILEGGAMRGMFTAGVCDVFLENGITFDGAIGVSAGALFGCNLKSKQIGRAIRYNKTFSRDKRYCSIRSLIKTGDLYNAEFCYNTLPNELDVFDYDMFRKNPMEFWVTTSDCETGLPVYKELGTCQGNELIWMRASGSMPIVSRVVEIENKKLLDGGITDSIPLEYFESLGYNKNIVVLTQPREYKKGPNKLIWLAKMMLKQYPNIIKAMANRHVKYNQQKEYVFNKSDRNEVLVICPDKPLDIKRTEKDPVELQRCYDAGRLAAKTRLQEIKDYLKK